MNQNSEMTRWSSPTNAAFYALHKGAINLYGSVAIVVQTIWLIFSVAPFAELIRNNTPQFSDYAVIIAGVILLFLHYMLHELLRYVFFNALDNDPNTVSSFMHYAVIAVITVGMFLLDLQGTTRFLRDESKFKNELSTQENAHRSDLDKTTQRQTNELDRMKATFQNDSSATVALFTPKLQSIKNRRCYDAFDIARRKRDFDSKTAEMNAAIAAKQTAYAEMERTTLAQHTAERNRLTKNADGTISGIKADDAENADKAESYGWIVSLICLFALLGCMFQTVDLRIGAGQKPISRFTIADATGSTTSKLADVVSDIWQRKSHQLLTMLHEWATSNTRELDTLDGAFKLKGGKYVSTTNNNGNNGGNTEGGNGGSGGGGSTPPQKPVPTGGNTQAAPQKAQTNVAVAVEGRREHKPFLEFDSHYHKGIAEVEFYGTEVYNFEEWFDAMKAINPMIRIVARTLTVENIEGVQKLATAYAQKRLNPTPSVKTLKYNDIENYYDRVEYAAIYDANMQRSSEPYLKLEYWMKALEAINPTFSFIGEDEAFQMDEIERKAIVDLAYKLRNDATLTPSVETLKTIPNPVPQPSEAVRTVPQPFEEKTPTLLDDKLIILRGKILKYGESHFNNSQANNGTIAKAIFKLCDEAFMALKKGGAVDKFLVKDFETAAKIRLGFCQTHGFEYDSFNELMSLIAKHKEGSHE